MLLTRIIFGSLVTQRCEYTAFSTMWTSVQITNSRIANVSKTYPFRKLKKKKIVSSRKLT